MSHASTHKPLANKPYLELPAKLLFLANNTPVIQAIADNPAAPNASVCKCIASKTAVPTYNIPAAIKAIAVLMSAGLDLASILLLFATNRIISLFIPTSTCIMHRCVDASTHHPS